MSNNRIKLRIDRLTLPAGSGNQRDQIKKAITQELDSYVRRSGVPKHWIKRDGVWVPRIKAQSGASPTLAGQNIARAIYRGEK